MSLVTTSTPRAIALGVFVAVHLVLLGLLAWGPGSGDLHEAPVGVVAPGVVGEFLAATNSSAELTTVLLDERTARARLAAGDVVAVVLVDLTTSRDTVLVAPAQDQRLVDAVVDRIRQFERAQQRTVAVRENGPGGSATVRDRLALTAIAASFVLALVTVAVRRARTHPRPGRVPRSALGTAAAAVVIGSGLSWLPLGLGLMQPAGSLVLALAVLGAWLLPAACAVAAGRTGLGVAAVIQLCWAAPLAGHLDDRLLPTSWAAAFPYTLPGATREALLDTAAGPPGARPVVVLLAWVAAGAVAAVYAVRRPDRPREDLPLLHAALAAVPAAAVLILAAALLPSGAPPAVPSAPATQTECLRVGPIRSVGDLNRIVRGVRGGPAFGGGDVGADVLLADGRRLMLFGDTVRPGARTGAFVRNSMLVVGDGCLSVVTPPGQGAVIPDRADGVGYWPMSVGVEHRAGYDLVLVGVQRVRSTGSGPFDFEALGPSAAVFFVPAGDTPQLAGVRDLGADSTDASRPMWGAAAAVADGWVYVYGTATPGEDLTFGYSLRVARMRPDALPYQSRWRYWDGQAWSSDPAAAAELVPAVGGVSQTLSVFEQGGTWYALSKQDEYLGRGLVVWTAPAPTGPFIAQPPVADLPSDPAAGLLRYMPLAHPDLLPRPGTVVVSYSTNRDKVEEVLADPRRYRPRFLRVRLP